MYYPKTGNIFRKKKFCDRAIVYLKERIPDEPSWEEPLEFSESKSPVVDVFSDECFIHYLVYDKRLDAFQYVAKWHLAEDGYTEEDLKKIGLNNLEVLSKKIGKVHKVESGVYRVILDNNFDAALILLDNIWETYLKRFIQNTFVIAIPARGVLAFCDSNNSDGIETLKKISEEAYKIGDHILCRKLYTRENGKWLPINA